jgi:hypothetical protein
MRNGKFDMYRRVRNDTYSHGIDLSIINKFGIAIWSLEEHYSYINKNKNNNKMTWTGLNWCVNSQFWCQIVQK